MNLSLRTGLRTVICVVGGMIAASRVSAAILADLPPAPATPAELSARIAQLRDHYAPYLRSLPKPLEVRSQEDLSGTWRWTFEAADGGNRDRAPDWYRPEFDDSGWEKTTVPEWRYDKSAPFGTKPDPEERRPDSRIAWYRTSFTGAKPQSGQRCFLVFAGVAWEAEVWLNGTRVGSHTAYWEPFRFEVTRLLREKNVLAVRVIAGPNFHEPTFGWTVLPCALAVQPRYVRDRSQSVIGQRELFGFKSSCFLSGFGIHREVLLETTGPACISSVRVRGDVQKHEAKIEVETDSEVGRDLLVRAEILPENFSGQSYSAGSTQHVRKGTAKLTIVCPVPQARLWEPAAPCLYRCRVTIRDGERIVDAQDALFGLRSFRLVTAGEAKETEGKRPYLREGMFLLNDRPVFLRGTDASPALNAFWYWRQDDTLRDVVLMMKAANFNAVRACEYVQFPEVRELLDRLGMMSEQDLVGANYCPAPMSVLAELSARLARVCFNNPGVVLLTAGGSETGFDPRQNVAAVLAVDPDRVIKPISGNMRDWGTAFDGPPGYPTLPDAYWSNVVDDFHCYAGWYIRGVWLSDLAKLYAPGRLATVGEFGVEALDCYATMQHYPPQLQPPPITARALWADCQVKRGDPKLTAGLRGREPGTLGEFIEASQNYQADALSEQATGFRISPRRIAGHFVFHFIDALPVEWPKAIVSFDGTPKKAFFAMAQVNQPLTPLFRLTDQGKTLELWVANDRSEALPGGRVAWSVEAGGKTLAQGEKRADVQPFDATTVSKIELSPAVQKQPTIMVCLTLKDADGTPISRYRREVFLKAWQPVHVEVQPPRKARISRLPDAGGDPAKVDWAKAALLADWRKMSDGGPSNHAIEARAAHDGRFLYVKCSEPVVSTELRSDPGIWAGDTWNLYFGPKPTKPLRQVGVNPKGALVERAFTDDEMTWPKCDVKVVSDATKDRWTVLMALPLDTVVSGGLKPGSIFYGNFERHVAAGDEYPQFIGWSPNYRDVWSADCSDRFGELRLE